MTAVDRKRLCKLMVLRVIILGCYVNRDSKKHVSGADLEGGCRGAHPGGDMQLSNITVILPEETLPYQCALPKKKSLICPCVLMCQDLN